MAQLADLASPKMRAATCLHCDDTRWQLAEKLQHLSPPQLLAQHRVAKPIGSMHLEHILRQIEPDSDNLRHDRSLCGSLQTHHGTQMPSGGGHIIKAHW
jgi:hypothetical protein